MAVLCVPGLARIRAGRRGEAAGWTAQRFGGTAGHADPIFGFISGGCRVVALLGHGHVFQTGARLRRELARWHVDASGIGDRSSGIRIFPSYSGLDGASGLRRASYRLSVLRWIKIEDKFC